MISEIEKTPFTGPLDDKFFCDVCDKSFSSKFNLKRHSKNVHGIEVIPSSEKDVLEKTFCCNICYKYFPSKFNLIRHKKSVHVVESSLPGMEESSTSNEKPFGCIVPECSAQVLNEKSLRSHERQKHGFQNYKYERKCPICGETSPEILQHLFDTHNISITVSEKSFDSFPCFAKWKLEMEKETQAFFRKYGSDEKNSNGTITCYYKCYRSGDFVSKSKGERHIKLTGTNKINGFCPAKIKVTRGNNDKCEVVFTETHVGHVCDLGHINMSKEERFALATKIAANIPFDIILDCVRTSVSDGQERIHLSTRKDLHNIKRSFHLSSSATKHENDSVHFICMQKGKNSCRQNIDLFEKLDGIRGENLVINEDQEQDVLIQELSVNKETAVSCDVDITEVKNDLKEKFCQLIDTIKTPEQCELISKGYKSLLATTAFIASVSKTVSFPTTTSSNASHNKKIISQRKFVTKKKEERGNKEKHTE